MAVGDDRGAAPAGFSDTPDYDDPSATLADLDGVPHRFFTRQGGVSDGLYSSLNCGYGSGDGPTMCARTAAAPPPQFGRRRGRPADPHQIHSTDVADGRHERWTSPGAPKADAMVTDRPGVVLGMLAADCAPVLFADAEARVIGAAHAGWSGALAGVVETTIAAMEELGARRERLRAAIGPCIGASVLRGRARSSPRRSWRRTRPTTASSARAARRPFPVRPRGLPRCSGCTLAGVGGERHRPRHAAPRPTNSSAIAATR